MLALRRARTLPRALSRALPRTLPRAPRRALAVSAKQVKELRASTGAPMIECKQALEEAGPDMEAALEWLRKKGTAVAAKKAGRETAQGLVGVAVAGGGPSGEDWWGALVEVNSETDFVARNERFVDLVGGIARAAVRRAKAHADAGLTVEALAEAETEPGVTVADALTDAITSIRENIVVRRVRVVRAAAGEGVIAPYVHGAAAPAANGVQAGRVGTLVALRGPAGAEPDAGLGRRLAMHVAAANPTYLARGDVPEEVLAKEREILRTQALEQGKPESVVDKMIQGRLNKFYEETCLADQTFLVASGDDGKPPKVAKVLPAGTEIQEFAKFVCGEAVK